MSFSCFLMKGVTKTGLMFQDLSPQVTRCICQTLNSNAHDKRYWTMTVWHLYASMKSWFPAAYVHLERKRWILRTAGQKVRVLAENRHEPRGPHCSLPAQTPCSQPTQQITRRLTRDHRVQEEIARYMLGLFFQVPEGEGQLQRFH